MMKCKIILLFLLITAPNYPTIHVIGDSHSNEFSLIDGCIIHHIGPVTMHRVGRDGLSILDFNHYGVKDHDLVILTFGEIDVRCHIGKIRDRFNIDLDQVIDDLLERYFRTILYNKCFYDSILIAVYTVTPPTDQVKCDLFTRYGKLTDRVNISRKLNEKLKTIATSHSIHIIDVYDYYADENGILLPLSSDGNVHINPSINQKIKEQISILNQCISPN